MLGIFNNWVTVCSSGKTIDGRVIKSATLNDIEETYNTSTRKALINFNHFLDVSLGEVKKLRVIENNNIFH